MINIFLPLDSANDKLIARIIALSKTLKKPGVVNTAKALIQPFQDFFASKDSRTRYEENLASLSNNRDELNSRLRAELRERAECDYYDDESLSEAIIDKAFSLNGTRQLTLRQRADFVAENFRDELGEQKSNDYLLSLGIKDINSINRKFLAYIILRAQDYNERTFAPTDEELAEWKKFHAARNQVRKDFDAYYNEQLPEENEFLSDPEISRRTDLLMKKSKRLRNFLKQTLDAEYLRRQKFSERAEIERDELEERCPVNFSSEWKYISAVNASNEQFIKKMHAGTIRLTNKNFVIPQLSEARFAEIEMLKTTDVIPRLHDAINYAKTEIDILVPWMYWSSIQNFLEDFRAAVNRNVVIKIHYGYKEKDYPGQTEDSKEAAEALRSALNSDNLHLFWHSGYGHHGKLVICDEEYYIYGSFNFLSYQGNKNEELTSVHYDKKTLLALRKELFDFEGVQ